MDKGYRMESNKSICKFIRDGKVEALAYRKGNLFEMDMKVLKKRSEMFVANCEANRNEFIKIFLENDNQTSNQVEEDSLIDESDSEVDQFMTNRNQTDAVINQMTPELALEENTSEPVISKAILSQHSTPDNSLGNKNKELTRDAKEEFVLNSNPRMKINFDKLLLSVMEDETRTYQETLKSKNAIKRKEDMNEEYRSLINNKTWLLCNFPVAVTEGFKMEILNYRSNSSNSNEESSEKYPYKDLEGSLMFLSITSRPDISYSVGVLSRYKENSFQLLRSIWQTF